MLDNDKIYADTLESKEIFLDHLENLRNERCEIGKFIDSKETCIFFANILKHMNEKEYDCFLKILKSAYLKILDKMVFNASSNLKEFIEKIEKEKILNSIRELK